MTGNGRAHLMRDGFAMLTVLWVITVAAALALAAELTGRDAYNGGRNRVYATRAYWRAADCMARARTLIDAELQATTDISVRADIWRTLGVRVAGDGFLSQPDCGVTFEAAGTRVDINAASDTILLALFDEMGYGDRSHEMLDAFRDWTDSDDVARPLGAEADWYAGQGRPTPRNGPLADIRELSSIRGFEDAVPSLSQVLSAEPGRISLSTAPMQVLAAVPGFSDEALEQLAELRADGEAVSDLASFANSLSPDAMTLMAAHFDEISRTVTVDPDAWIVRATGTVGLPAITTTLEFRLILSGDHAEPVRQRVDP